MRNNNFLVRVVLILSLACSFQFTVAEDAVVPPFNSTEFFYEIGGGTSIQVSGGVQVPDLMMLERDFAMLLGIGGFDPVASIKATLNNLQNELESKLVGIGETITSSISAIPGYVFCRANPLGCQMHENYTERAEEKAKEAVAYLEDMETKLGDSKQQLEGWFQAAKAGKLVDSMKEARAAGITDLQHVVDEVKEFSGEEGLKWLGGEFAGGDAQPPIRPIADTTKAGFNMLLGRPVTTKTTVSTDDPLTDIWDTPEEAGKWITEVVGEFRPDINDNNNQYAAGYSSQGSDDGDSGLGGEDVTVTSEFLSEDTSTPALGLITKVRKETIAVQDKLVALSNVSGIPTADQVRQVMGDSSNSVLPRDIFSKLKRSPIESVLIKKLADDIAINNVIRYAMEARRLLIAGRNEPHIAAYEVAQKEIQQKIDILEADIEMLMFEREVSRQLVGDTIQKIYAHSNSLNNTGGLIGTGRTRLGNGVSN